MRIRDRGWYKLDGTNMEGTGVQPDILVENLPADIIREQETLNSFVPFKN